MPSSKKPHVRLNTQKQSDGAVTLKFNYAPPADDENDRKEAPNYRQMATYFAGYITKFNADLNRRQVERSIPVPDHIEYIRITFQSQFSLYGERKYFEIYYNEYGLLGITFSKFNHEVLFAIIDRGKFQSFINNIQNFINKESGNQTDLNYSKNVLYIKEFKLLTTADIIQYRDQAALLNFRLAEFPLDADTANRIYANLTSYLNDKGLRFRLVRETSNLEIYDLSNDDTKEIVNNFDIILSVTSALSTIVRPTEFNTVERGYGFTISNSDDDLPIIGVLDTGISNQTPLAPILLNDISFNLTGSSVFVDNANGGYGHGTSVAALAALGRDPYAGDYRGENKADAKLLSMKLLDSNSGFLSELDVLDLLRNAKQKYPQIKLFVLTIGYDTNKRTNEDFSTYAYELDKFSYENDCLIFICTANNSNASLQNSSYDLNYFFSEITNLCVPADSLNNVIVGAAAHSIKHGVFYGISHGKEYPTLFTRKSHIEMDSLFPKGKRNKNYFRPDILECAGDYEQRGTYIDKDSNALIDLLSANPAFGFYKDAGTSFAAPLAANIAAKLLKLYHNLKSQTIKALIINSASLNNIKFIKPLSSLLNKTAGHGFADPAKTILSNSNEITFIIEDSIKPEEVKIIPLNFPAYLSTEDLGKTKGILTVTATLCFSFSPIPHNQLAYCPVHMAFCFYRNQSGEDILKSEDSIKSKLNSTLTWTQNGRYKSKPIPSFNTQKKWFKVNVSHLVDEKSTLKLAINCRLNSQILPGLEERYKDKDQAFSIVISIREDLPEARLTNKLYDEMIAVNEIENITIADIEGELEAEA